ncbi:MAG TPA: DUF58 domain-containing protein [Nitrospiria bacterium]|nr:DUF58 domain-containing protein [Nitrospiria bacterium]
MKLLTSPSPALRYRNRSIRLTSEGLLFLFLTLLVGVTAINTGNNLLYLLMALMLTLIMISGILSEWGLKGIHIEHRMPPHIFAQDPVVCRWLIHNKKSFFPSFTIKAVALYPDMISSHGISVSRILAGSTELQSSTLSFAHRGIFRSAGYEISTSFPFGFFEKAVAIPSSSEVVVYPKLHRLWVVQGGSLLAGGGQEVRKKGRGPALYNLRDYQQGDDSRDIHWKISARQSKLFIQEHEKDEERRVHIWLSNQLPPASSDPSPSPGLTEDFEEAVSLAASLVHTFIQKGYEVGLSTLDREIPSRYGMTHGYRILQTLALLNPVSATNASKNLQRLAGRLFSRPHQVILVLPWEDPYWKAREAYFTRIITPSQWRQSQGQGGVL